MSPFIMIIINIGRLTLYLICEDLPKERLQKVRLVVILGCLANKMNRKTSNWSNFNFERPFFKNDLTCRLISSLKLKFVRLKLMKSKLMNLKRLKSELMKMNHIA
jgi:hypothetical protein